MRMRWGNVYKKFGLKTLKVGGSVEITCKNGHGEVRGYEGVEWNELAQEEGSFVDSRLN